MDNWNFFNSIAEANRKKWLSADSEDSDNGSNAKIKGVSNFFVLKIVNAGGATISNVDIGDSYANRSLSNFGNNIEIAVTSAIPGVTYQEWLAQTESRPFRVGRTEIISATSNQLNESFALTHRNASGEAQSEALSPDMDPYQRQTDRIRFDYDYLFDGFSRVRIGRVLPTATIYLKIWPSAIYSATQELAGNGDVELFTMPKVL